MGQTAVREVPVAGPQLDTIRRYPDANDNPPDGVPMHRSPFSLVIALGAGLMSLSAATAQTPTDAQKEAIRSDCRGDFIKHCSGVEPGGMPALQCLEQNMASLSAACQAAVKPVQAETGGSSGG